MHPFLRLLADGIAAFKSAVIDFGIAERNIGGHDVEIAVSIFRNVLKPFRMDGRRHCPMAFNGVKYLGGEQVFFITYDLAAGYGQPEMLPEDAHSGAGIEDAGRNHVGPVNSLSRGLYDDWRGIECRQHRVFQAVDVLFIFPLAGGVLADEVVQFPHQRE